MPQATNGIHHITSIASDPKENLRFYTRDLGLRFVKRTVNFDDPATYHFYFGDESGTPGSIMTFFPWPGVKRGRHGTGQAEEVGYAVPKSSIGWWLDWLKTRGLPHEGPNHRFDETVIALSDPDGHLVEIVGTDWANSLPGFASADIPAKHAIRGFSGVCLWLRDSAATKTVLSEVFGFVEGGRDAGRLRLVAAGSDSGPGRTIDIREVGDYPAGGLGAGIVHHIAFRAASDQQQAELAQLARGHSRQVTPLIDRTYFRSVYFREPGGVLLEIATDAPGFTIDEPLESLGETLKLPPQYEPQRDRIAEVLPSLEGS